MKRSGFKRPVYEPAPTVLTPAPKGLAERVKTGQAELRVMPKSEPIQHQGYMAAVRKLPCYRCGVVGFTEFAHRDEGKGAGMKTDCREGWPGCGMHYEGGKLVNGCHFDVGTKQILGKEGRRKFEDEAGRATRDAIRQFGLWPKGLADWPEDE